MALNLFSKFILWLKKILRVHPKGEYERATARVTPQPEEKLIRVVLVQEKPSATSSEEEKPAEAALPEKKTTALAALPETRALEVTSEIVPQEQSGEEILTKGPSQRSDVSLPTKGIGKQPEEEFPLGEVKNGQKIVEGEEEDTAKLRKPYKKKAPTEERKGESIKPPTNGKETSRSKQRKTIDLGDTQRRGRRLTGALKTSVTDENIEEEIVDKEPEEKEFATSVESPFVEIDLDNANVCLILPKQQYKGNAVDEIPQKLSYSLDLNGTQQEVPVKIAAGGDGLMFLEEKRILLEEPLVRFQVTFPDVIQRREYSYNHHDKRLYAFVAIGNNRGRMYYLYDKDGNISSVPKRHAWILLDEDFVLQNDPDVIEEKCIWGRYWPFRINLTEIGALVIKNRISSEEKSFDLQSTFHVEGEQVVKDDFEKESPLFTGKTIRIIAPHENKRGWNVWILHKAVSAQIVSEDWTGNKPLTLSCPKDLPFDCGEFQIDICQKGTRTPDETIFFRLMPYIELNYPKELIIPDSNLGHITTTIDVRLGGDDEWLLEHRKDGEVKVKLKQKNYYEIELSPQEDTYRFSLAKASRSELVVNFQVTIPRMKWKTSNQRAWDCRLQQIERKDLKPGETILIMIQTNDIDYKHALLALLKTNDRKLQEGRFVRKGIEYILELNQFYDTIIQNKEDLRLEVEVRKITDNQILNKFDILNIASAFIRCKQISCSFKSRDMQEIISHFEEFHIDDLIEPITYEELRKYIISLPTSIYECSYCGFYVRGDDPLNPTSAIIEHIKRDCKEVDRSRGPVKIDFTPVFRIDEIRQHVLPDLPDIRKCKLCGIHFRNYSEKAKAEHFFEKHANEIYEYCGR